MKGIVLPTRKEAEIIFSYKYRPLDWVLDAYDWGNPPYLEGRHLEGWQRDELQNLQDELQKIERDGTKNAVIRVSIASGHGIGKSCFMALIVNWFNTCHRNSKGVVTANTEGQLKGKTWAEVSKWHMMSRFRKYYVYEATKLSAIWDQKNQVVQAIPWSEKRSQAFAGEHSNWVLFLFDEASTIAKTIWEVSEGAMTSGICIWLVFGNPSEPSGEFYNTFYSKSHRWRNKRIDSRTVSFTNKEQINEWIEDYGVDSDFVKVRVLGEFPSHSDEQFIPDHLIERAMETSIISPRELPTILSCDPARYGPDSTCVYIRRGRQSLELRQRRQLDTIQVAEWIQDIYYEFDEDIDAIVIDASAAGVIDTLKLWGFEITAADFGSSSVNKKYRNKRVEMYSGLRDYLADGGTIPNDEELKEELRIQRAMYPDGNEVMYLLGKKSLKVMLGRSPDKADALALSFYRDFPKRTKKLKRVTNPNANRRPVEYNPMSVL